MQNQTEICSLTLQDRKCLSLTCVDSVDSFSEQNIKLQVRGEKVLVSGENIKITSFNKATGLLCADGLFTTIKYLGKSTPLIKKLLKWNLLR